MFLYRKMLKNRIRKIVRKPATCIYVLFIIVYFGWLAWTLDHMIMESNFGTRENLARVLCMLAIYLTPANYASFAKRKGLVFLPGDVHFLFSSPASPKGNLLYVYGKTLAASMIMGFIMIAVGIRWFHVSAIQMLLYVLVCVVLDSVL